MQTLHSRARRRDALGQLGHALVDGVAHALEAAYRAAHLHLSGMMFSRTPPLIAPMVTTAGSRFRSGCG
jgi:hypothetical protein